MEEGSFNEGEAFFFFKSVLAIAFEGRKESVCLGCGGLGRHFLIRKREEKRRRERKRKKRASGKRRRRKKERKKDWDNKKGKPPRKWEGRLSGRTRKESWPRGLVWFGLV
ncbi:hypothetical protein BP00DRAFT_239914 [Aspergillus indologenus CBS 114.80]|uniref:Uncharacterized protein n=1 Tax=Aspergillus indologenus CBS 114.80 TaxID=1450541 RepID=A0A2V5IY93_9EURO|nr:hypothetical protein BP00DRAFT_239914 [Aspergillus indologenus CBS 114.80]